MKLIRTFSRIFIGLVFIFSGFVKGVDPLGTAYRIEDYFIAYGWDWALPFALFLSISLCTLEFLLGVALVFNLRLKELSWPLLFLVIFFTVTTLYDALYEPVPDCGCFGDAIKLSNWETFYKNIVLIILVTIIFIERKKFKNPISGKWQTVFTGVIIVGFSIFSLYQYNHLPWLDFRGWKIGTDLVPDNSGKARIYLKYKNTETGEEREYLSPDYPWDDSVWMSKWKFVDQRIDDSDVIKGHSLAIYDLAGNDVTDNFIENPGYQFLLISYDLAAADQEGLRKAAELYSKIEQAGYSFIVLTGSLEEEIDSIGKDIHPHLEFYNADDIELKTIVRANPGLVLIKNGIVIDKWHYNDFPYFQELEEDYLNK